MSKKLLIAVLTLGMFLTWVMAYAIDDGKVKDDRVPITYSSQLENAAVEIQGATSVMLEKPAANAHLLATPATVLPPGYYCEPMIGHSTTFLGWEDFPYYAAGLDYPYMEYQVQAAEGYACTLLTINIGLNDLAYVGTPDLEVVVWDDDWAYPVTEYARITIPFADLPNDGIGPNWLSVDVSGLNLVFSNGDAFRVGFTVTDDSKTANESVGLLWDDGSVTNDMYGFWWAGGPFWAWYGPVQAYAINLDVCIAQLVECYTQSYHCGTAYYFGVDDAGLNYPSMRMSTEQSETLKSIGVRLYGAATTAGTDVDIFAWGVAAGSPDLSDVIFQTTVPYASLVFYPTWLTVDCGPVYPIIGVGGLPADFFVGISVNDASGGATGILSDAGTCPSGRSKYYDEVDLAWYTIAYNWQLRADLCVDKYTICRLGSSYWCNVTYYWGFPSGNLQRTGTFQKVEPIGVGCRLERIRVAWYPGGAGTSDFEIRVYDSDGLNGLPGTMVYNEQFSQSEIDWDADWFTVDVSAASIRFDAPIWFGFNSLSPTAADIRTLTDDGTCYEPLTAAVYYNPGTGGVFAYMEDYYVDPFEVLMEADICCEPPPEMDCSLVTGDGWPVSAHDFRRTNRSFNTTGDAQCKQALATNGYYTHPAGHSYNRAVIYDHYLVTQHIGRLSVFDIDNVAAGPIFTPFTVLPYMTSACVANPTVVDGYVYFGGSGSRGVTKANVVTGAIAWSRNIGNFPFGTGPGTGLTTSSMIVVLDGVVYITTDDGYLYAVNDADGLDFGGWTTNPIVLDGNPYATLSSNGVDKLYVGTDGRYGTGYGTLYAFDAATGAMDWSLGEGDMYGSTIDLDATGTLTDEDFYGPIGVDVDGNLYFSVSFDVFGGNEVNGPPTGAAYCVDADGTIIWGVSHHFNQRCGVALDVNNVVMTGYDPYIGRQGGARCFNKLSGGVVWDAYLANPEWYPPKIQAQPNPVTEEFAAGLVEGILDCRMYEADLYYQTNTDGNFLAFNADNGLVEFEYYYRNNPTGGNDNGACVVMDATHLVFINRQGDIYVMTEQSNRPRLRILNAFDYADVAFLSPPSTIVTFENVFMNNGCANLIGTLTADEVLVASEVNPGRITRMMNMANNLVDYTYPALAKALAAKPAVLGPNQAEEEFETSAYSKDAYSNMVAYAPPAWLNEIDNASFNLAPGAVADVVLDVNGPLVTRGAHDCFITIASNDQFYLNSTMSPVIMLGVVGGCVSSTDTLYWGMNYPGDEPPALGANYSVVYNSGTIAGDARNDGFMISIDGEEEYFCYFCGMLLFGQAEHKLAWTGTFDSDSWETLMTDPNCAAQCQTYFSRGIVLGEYWDGTDWADIYGEAGTYTYVDSVIAYDCAGAWDWYDHDCGYDNSLTMGISVKCTEYGAYGMPELNNFKICKLDITNRNAAPITDPIYYAQWVDHDLGNDYDEGYDFERYFFLDDYDVAWGGACEGSGFELGTNVWGSGSIGHPMRGVITCRNDQLNGGYMFDSMYYWMSTVTGPRYQPGLDPIEDGCTDEFSDRQAIYLYDGFTFGANETISTGFYIFGYSHIAGGADTYDTALIISTALAAQQFSGFGRGDMNGDMKINLVDVVLLWNIIDGTVPPLKYRHLTDVNADGTTDLADVVYLADYHFNQGPAPVGEWTLPDICPQP